MVPNEWIAHKKMREAHNWKICKYVLIVNVIFDAIVYIFILQLLLLR